MVVLEGITIKPAEEKKEIIVSDDYYALILAIEKLTATLEKLSVMI